jgi:hypothetical protein
MAPRDGRCRIQDAQPHSEGTPITHVDRIGLRSPAAWTSMRGRIAMWVQNLIQPGCSEASARAPTPIPDSSKVYGSPSVSLA